MPGIVVYWGFMLAKSLDSITYTHKHSKHFLVFKEWHWLKTLSFEISSLSTWSIHMLPICPATLIVNSPNKSYGSEKNISQSLLLDVKLLLSYSLGRGILNPVNSISNLSVLSIQASARRTYLNIITEDSSVTISNGNITLIGRFISG